MLTVRPAVAGVAVAGGSSGWQAPEQLIAKDGGAVRQSRAVDVFSLGCIMYYCLTGGKHPFGEQYERDTNIMRGLPNLNGLMSQPEAHNLVTAMLSKSPSARPSMSAVLGHPFWWTDEQRLQFLVDVSDRWGSGAHSAPRGLTHMACTLLFLCTLAGLAGGVPGLQEHAHLIGTVHSLSGTDSCYLPASRLLQSVGCLCCQHPPLCAANICACP